MEFTKIFIYNIRDLKISDINLKENISEIQITYFLSKYTSIPSICMCYELCVELLDEGIKRRHKVEYKILMTFLKENLIKI